MFSSAPFITRKQTQIEKRASLKLQRLVDIYRIEQVYLCERGTFYEVAELKFVTTLLLNDFQLEKASNFTKGLMMVWEVMKNWKSDRPRCPFYQHFTSIIVYKSVMHSFSAFTVCVCLYFLPTGNWQKSCLWNVGWYPWSNLLSTSKTDKMII